MPLARTAATCSARDHSVRRVAGSSGLGERSVPSKRGPMRSGPRIMALVAVAVAVACGQTGIVEADWQFVDRRIAPIYPGGGRQDACGLDGQSNNASTPFDLRVRIIAESLDGEGDSVESPLFSCDRARGAITDVVEGSYRMRLEVWAEVADRPPFRVSPDCIAGPGPRDRTVARGRITDLSVWQFVANALDLDDTVNFSMNLDDCEWAP